MAVRTFCIASIFTFSLLLFILVLPLPAFGHMTNISSSDLQIEDSQIHWTLRVHRADFDFKRAQMEAIGMRDFIAERVIVEVGGKKCPMGDVSIDTDAATDNMIISLTFNCEKREGNVHLSYGLFFGDLNHKHMMKFDRGGESVVRTFSPYDTEADFSLVPSIWPGVMRFLAMGFEHILTGYDHLLFLFSLILGARRLTPLVLMITAFTISHSATLALAVLGVISISVKFVECMIALSIICIALTHLFKGELKRKRYYLGVTFFFGLIHGLGFSSILKDVGLIPGEMLVPLLSFNLGVEGGQMLFIGGCYPLLRLVQKKTEKYSGAIERTMLIMITLIACYWLITRLLFS